MTACVNYHGIASDCYSGNTCNVGGGLYSWCSEPDGVAFAGNTAVADVDIQIACGEAATGGDAPCNIPVAACVTTKRKGAVGCVLGAGCVVLKRSDPRGCVVVARRVVLERTRAVGGVLPTRCIIPERKTTGGCV